MQAYLGFDTSNYTSSVAVYTPHNMNASGRKQLIPVKPGETGARQSDAVFHHVRQLPVLLGELLADCEYEIAGVGASVRPRPIDGSYMPCFEVGRSVSEQIAAVLRVPHFACSHQEGHIAAALYSAGCYDSIGERFIAFHVSGGTTEAVMVTKTELGFSCDMLASSLDLKAGQAIDRVARMLELPFPGGPHLEKLALEWTEPVKVKPTMKGANCCLSGVENICQKMILKGEPREKVARTCLEYVRVTLEAMTKELLALHGQLPLLYAGGVMSNSIIRESFEREFGAYFAAPEYSCDNACGVALLTARALCDESRAEI